MAKSALAAAATAAKARSARTVRAFVRLERLPDGVDDPVARSRSGVGVPVSIAISRASNGDDDGDVAPTFRKYSMCSLLLKVGRLLGVKPRHAPSPLLSSILNGIFERWRLRREADDRRAIDRPSDIDDGDELVLCCGEDAQNRDDAKVDLLNLIPTRYHTVQVSLASASKLKHDEDQKKRVSDESEDQKQTELEDISLVGDGEDDANESGHNNDDDADEDDDSSIEDVTDHYISRKRPASPEVINLEDVSSDDESEDCFWEYDEHGNMKKSSNRAKSSSRVRRDDDEGAESVGSDSSSSSSEVEDVTELMMAKRSEEVQEMMAKAEEIDDSDSDCAGGPSTTGKKRKRKRRSQSTAKRRRTKKPPECPIEVVIDDEDIPTRPGSKAVAEDEKDGSGEGGAVDLSVKQRIVKLLNTGFHDNSNEHEARNAMKLARRLMERHNLDQAVLLQERGDGSLNDFSTSHNEEGAALQGGVVTARIRDKKRGKPLHSLPRWNDYLVSPVCLNFRVEAFKTFARGSAWREGECSVTFYGVRTNAQLAAYAFKIASERIALMAASYEPPRREGVSSARQVAETRGARLSYALGVVNGLEREVKEGLRREEEARKAKLRRAQRAARTGEAYHEDCFGDDSDGDEKGPCEMHEKSSKTEEDQDDGESGHGEPNCLAAGQSLDKLERENTAHLALIDHRKKIASDVLKSKNIKVRTAPKRKSISLNRKAYQKGVIDSKEIDLNQQAIQGE